MNYLEILLHPGSSHATAREEIADCLLTPARCLWLNREVVNISDGFEGPSIETPGFGDPLSCFAKRRPPNEPYSLCSPNFGTLILCIVNMALIEFPAALLACSGMPLKHYELSTNKEAASYSELVCSLLVKEELHARISILEKKLKSSALKNVVEYDNLINPPYYLQKAIKWKSKLDQLKVQLSKLEQSDIN